MTCVYDKKWWLACVLDINDSQDEFKLSFMKPHGPVPSFTYPARSDILTVPTNFILTKVDPRTPTGRAYNLSEREASVASRKLQLWKINQC